MRNAGSLAAPTGIHLWHRSRQALRCLQLAGVCLNSASRVHGGLQRLCQLAAGIRRCRQAGGQLTCQAARQAARGARGKLTRRRALPLLARPQDTPPRAASNNGTGLPPRPALRPAAAVLRVLTNHDVGPADELAVDVHLHGGRRGSRVAGRHRVACRHETAQWGESRGRGAARRGGAGWGWCGWVGVGGRGQGGACAPNTRGRPRRALLPKPQLRKPLKLQRQNSIW